uniref:Reverse transcriptase domain-containing protein n=1 Tax=Tanacetum cinerariifolium TaxID=118510 RepID=A0A6L2IZZ2_TANCI|nr:hypothetical protein [Tanacetum cinerariifolium]
MARMDAMTMKMDAQYKDFQSRSKQSNLDDDDDIPMSREKEAKFMQTFRRTRFYNDYRDQDSNRDNWRSSGRNNYNRENYQSHYDDKLIFKNNLMILSKLNIRLTLLSKTPSWISKTNTKQQSKTSKPRQNLKAKFDRLADKQSG